MQNNTNAIVKTALIGVTKDMLFGSLIESLGSVVMPAQFNNCSDGKVARVTKLIGIIKILRMIALLSVASPFLSLTFLLSSNIS